ncbi:hypothetical protein D3C85_1373050 [compost metagenome]
MLVHLHQHPHFFTQGIGHLVNNEVVNVLDHLGQTTRCVNAFTNTTLETPRVITLPAFFCTDVHRVEHRQANQQPIQTTTIDERHRSIPITRTSIDSLFGIVGKIQQVDRFHQLRAVLDMVQSQVLQPTMTTQLVDVIVEVLIVQFLAEL